MIWVALLDLAFATIGFTGQAATQANGEVLIAASAVATDHKIITAGANLLFFICYHWPWLRLGFEPRD